MEIKLISCTDDMVDVWKISRPYVIDTDVKNQDLLKMNLPINQFKTVTLYIKSSILFRDLIFTFRPISEWARSNRTIKFTKDNLRLSDDIFHLLDSKLRKKLESDLNYVIDRVNSGEKQDYVKQSLPLMTETEFCINVNYRTLINIMYTFWKHYYLYFAIFYEELIKVLDGFENDYEIAVKSDLFNDVALTDKELELPEGTQSIASVIVTKVKIRANLMAQFIRQHSSTIKNGLWNLVDNNSPYVASMDCSIDVDCIAIISESRWKNLVSTRTCWFAQFDSGQNSSWSYVLGDYVQTLSDKDFLKQLPCKGICKNCKILKDMEPRILHTEVNPPCPILIENPYIIDQRIMQYHSDSLVMNKWKRCKNMIKYNPFNQNNKLYSSIDKEAGTNVKTDN